MMILKKLHIGILYNNFKNKIFSNNYFYEKLFLDVKNADSAKVILVEHITLTR